MFPLLLSVAFASPVAIPTVDLDGDGFPELALLDPWGEREGSAGRVAIRSGRTGAIVWSAAFNPGFGSSFTPLGDLDGDGSVEFAIGSPDESHAGHRAAGAIYVFSLTEASMRGALAGELPGEGLGDEVIALDRDRDGVAEHLVAGHGPGAVLVRLGNEGRLLVRDEGEITPVSARAPR